MWTLRRVGGLEAASNIEGCGSAFLVLEAAAVLVCVPEKTQSGSPYAAEPPQAARPHCRYRLRRPAVPESLWAPRPEQAPPRQPYTAHASGTIFRRLLDVFTERLYAVTRGGWLKGAS